MIQIKNWSKFQSYKDRRPPWIRFHRSILDDFKFQSMSADSRAILPMFWLLACEYSDPKAGIVDASIEEITFRLRSCSKIITKVIKELQDADFIECIDSVTKSLHECNETVPPETETETETKAEERQNDVLSIFSCWQETMNHPHAKLDSKREKRIKDALQMGYSVDQLKRAILGCSYSRWHMGENDRKKRFDSIDLIFRDADKIDGFIAQQPERDPGDFLDGWDGTFSGVRVDNVIEGEVV